jgi:hypothetical protein
LNLARFPLQSRFNDQAELTRAAIDEDDERSDCTKINAIGGPQF